MYLSHDHLPFRVYHTSQLATKIRGLGRVRVPRRTVGIESQIYIQKGYYFFLLRNLRQGVSNIGG